MRETPTLTEYRMSRFDASHYAVLLLAAAVAALIGIAAYAEITGLQAPCIRVERNSLSITYSDSSVLVRLPLHNYCGREVRLTRITIEADGETRTEYYTLSIGPGEVRNIEVTIPDAHHVTLKLQYLVDDRSVVEEVMVK